MKAQYFCPTCHVFQRKSYKRQISSINCCLECSNFVKAAINPESDWFDAFAERKKLNPRHPRINAPLLGKVIKDRKLEGEYIDKDIIRPLSEMREELNKLIELELKKLGNNKVIFNSLRTLDRLYGSKLEKELTISNSNMSLPNQRISDQNLAINQNIGLAGKALERIIETALAKPYNEQRIENQQPYFFPLYELSSESVFLNEILEGFVCLWNRGKLIISRDDFDICWHGEDQQKLQNIKNKLSGDDVENTCTSFKEDKEFSHDQYILALKELSKGTANQGILKDPDMEEFIRTIDGEHRKLFGHSFSERLLAVLYLAELPIEIRQDWAFEETIIEFLGNRIGISKETGISLLCALSLTGAGISQENAHPFDFGRRFRLIRRPLPMLKVGNRNIYYVSAIFLGRNLLHINAEYTDGSYPELKDTIIQTELIQKLNRQYTNYFVKERVTKILSDFGFVVEPHVKRIGHLDIESAPGEIDILAQNKKRDHLFIVECKFRFKPFINVREFRHEIAYYTNQETGYVSKLNKKLKWVNEHKREVLEFLDYKGKIDEVICIPVFITNFYTPASEFITNIEFVKEKNLNSWVLRFN